MTDDLRERVITALKHSSVKKRRFATAKERAFILLEAENYPPEVQAQMAKDLVVFPIFDAMAMWLDMEKLAPSIRYLITDFVDNEPIEITQQMTKLTEFEAACNSMKGHYSSEIGMMEADSGGETHFDMYETRKEWCTFKKEELIRGSFSIFSIPGEADLQLDDERVSPIGGIRLEGEIGKDFSNERICFGRKKFSHVPGVTKFCVEKDRTITFPETENALFEDNIPVSDFEKYKNEKWHKERIREGTLFGICSKMKTKVSASESKCVLKSAETKDYGGKLQKRNPMPIIIEQVGDKAKIDIQGFMKGEISNPKFYSERSLDKDNSFCVASANPKRGKMVDGLTHVCISDGYWTISFPEWGWLERPKE